VEERGTTSFLLGGIGDAPAVYADPAEALASFRDLERGLVPTRRGQKNRPLLGRLRRRLSAPPARAWL